MNNKDSPIVYICSPYSGDVEANVKKARAYSRLAVDRGCVPLTPHLFLPAFISEETERETALKAGLKLLSVCREIWVCGGTVSSGMRNEIQHAKALGIPIRAIKEEEINVCD